MASLTEVDSLDIRVLVNDQLDNIAGSRHPEVHAPGAFSHVPKRFLGEAESQARGQAKIELHLPSSCCGVHGLSLMITASKGDKKHTLLFDAGPEGEIWEKNVTRLKLGDEVGKVELIHLSHWHRDHSGGLENAIRMINSGKSTGDKVTIDLHPERPEYRGIMTPRGPVTLEADPSFAELEAAGASVDLHGEAHTVLDDMFLISGEIPRTTSYETGFPNGVRLNAQNDTEWQTDTLIKDERFVMCKLAGKGLVVFTGCSHAGVVNVARHAAELASPKEPLFAVIGGFHLSDAQKDKLQSTVEDLGKLKPTVLMPGHCSGWRFQVEAEKIMPESVVPLYCGQEYKLSA